MPLLKKKKGAGGAAKKLDAGTDSNIGAPPCPVNPTSVDTQINLKGRGRSKKAHPDLKAVTNVGAVVPSLRGKRRNPTKAVETTTEAKKARLSPAHTVSGDVVKKVLPEVNLKLDTISQAEALAAVEAVSGVPLQRDLTPPMNTASATEGTGASIDVVRDIMETLVVDAVAAAAEWDTGRKTSEVGKSEMEWTGPSGSVGVTSSGEASSPTRDDALASDAAEAEDSAEDTNETAEDEMDEQVPSYEEIQRRNIQERQLLFKQMGFGNLKQDLMVENKKKTVQRGKRVSAESSGFGKARKEPEPRTLQTRKSSRLIKSHPFETVKIRSLANGLDSESVVSGGGTVDLSPSEMVVYTAQGKKMCRLASAGNLTSAYLSEDKREVTFLSSLCAGTNMTFVFRFASPEAAERALPDFPTNMASAWYEE